jgi:hypothetical protein
VKNEYDKGVRISFNTGILTLFYFFSKEIRKENGGKHHGKVCICNRRRCFRAWKRHYSGLSGETVESERVSGHYAEI